MRENDLLLFVPACITSVRRLVLLAIVVMVLVEIAQAAPPNVLLIMTDDLGWMDMYCQGNERLNIPRIESPGGAVRAGPYRLIRRYDDNSLELFDLSADIGEQPNLAVVKPELAAKLNEQLDLWLKETTAQMLKRRN